MEKKNAGIFYAVGVGPGDPQLMTFQAADVIRDCDVLVLPVSDKSLEEPVFEQTRGEVFGMYAKSCVAYMIASKKIKEAERKPVLYLPMPMIKDREKLKRAHDAGVSAVSFLLDEGKNTAFITLGDPSVYSTCLYIKKRLDKKAYRTVVVPGIPSFIAAAAKSGRGLAENREMLHVIPGSYGVGEALQLSGTKILMKAGKTMPLIKEELEKCGADVFMVENCGMEGEKMYYGAENIPEDAGYYSLIIVRESK